jgi:hypothetical protein
VVDKPWDVQGEIVFDRQDIEIGPKGSITIRHDSVLILKHATLSGVSDRSLIFEDDTSVLCLRDVGVEFDWCGYNFRCGTIIISRDCTFYGGGWCCCGLWPAVVAWDNQRAAIVRYRNATLELDGLLVHQYGSSSSYTIKNAFKEKDFTPLKTIAEADAVASPVTSDDEQAPLMQPAQIQHKKRY